MNALADVFQGWQGYQTSLLRAIKPRTPAELRWRPAPNRRSVGEIARHISMARIDWFSRMGAPGVEDVTAKVPKWKLDPDGGRHPVEDVVPADSASALSEWLVSSWEPIARVLSEWSVDDLVATYEHRWQGDRFALTRQWTVWRIMAHDHHHGGQISILLACQGVDAFELQKLGGHIVELTPIPGEESP